MSREVKALSSFESPSKSSLKKDDQSPFELGKPPKPEKSAIPESAESSKKVKFTGVNVLYIKKPDEKEPKEKGAEENKQEESKEMDKLKEEEEKIEKVK